VLIDLKINEHAISRVNENRKAVLSGGARPCEVAIIAAFNKFDTLQAQDLDKRDDSFGSIASEWQSTGISGQRR
jgi:hypothetical protein